MSRGKHKNFHFFSFPYTENKQVIPRISTRARYSCTSACNFVLFCTLSVLFLPALNGQQRAYATALFSTVVSIQKTAICFPFVIVLNSVFITAAVLLPEKEFFSLSPRNVLTLLPAIGEPIRARFSRATELDSEPDF